MYSAPKTDDEPARASWISFAGIDRAFANLEVRFQVYWFQREVCLPGLDVYVAATGSG